MNQLKNKLQRFMIGRYGPDQLGRFLTIVVLILIFLNLIINVRIISGLLNVLELAVFFVLYFRMFSKNISKRYEENQAYMRFRFYWSEHWKKTIFRVKEQRKNKIFKCPGCGQKVRIPRGHGKVSIHCPKCGADFIKRT